MSPIVRFPVVAVNDVIDGNCDSAVRLKLQAPVIDVIPTTWDKPQATVMVTLPVYAEPYV